MIALDGRTALVTGEWRQRAVRVKWAERRNGGTPDGSDS